MEKIDISQLQEIYNPEIEALLIELSTLYPMFIDTHGADITRYIFIRAGTQLSEEKFLIHVVRQLETEFCGWSFLEELDYFEEHGKEAPPYLYKEILTGLFEASQVFDKPSIESKSNSIGNEIVFFSWRGKDYNWSYSTPDAITMVDSSIYFQFFDLMNSNTDYRWRCNVTERGVIEDSYICYAYVPKFLDRLIEKYLPNYIQPIITYCKADE